MANRALKAAAFPWLSLWVIVETIARVVIYVAQALRGQKPEKVLPPGSRLGLPF